LAKKRKVKMHISSERDKAVPSDETVA